MAGPSSTGDWSAPAACRRTRSIFSATRLGSFSSLQIAPGSWKRVGDHYEATLWTLPDRGRNDPGAKLFFDYPARLERFRIRFTPNDGALTLIPDGGLELRDFRGRPFTGADPGTGTLTQRGIVLPAPASGPGSGKLSLDAESLAFTHDGGFYVGDEYTANVYYFDRQGRLRGVIQPPAAIVPRRDGRPDFGSLQPPETGRRNNQGPEGMSLSPDGRTLFVALQSALMQDSATGNAAGRTDTRILVYDVSRTPTPARPVAHHVMQLPAYDGEGNGGAPDRTAAQSEIRALDDHSFLMLARDGAGVGAGKAPIVYKSILLVDVAGATNLAGTDYESGTASLLLDPRRDAAAGHRPGRAGRTGQHAQSRAARALRAERRGAVREMGSAGSRIGDGAGPSGRLFPVRRQRQRLHRAPLPDVRPVLRFGLRQ